MTIGNQESSHYFKCRPGCRLPRSAIRSLVVSCLILAAAAVGASAAAQDEARWNVLLITVDCMRPDHMSIYGYERDTTPNLARFADESLVFENAFATSSWTSPGVVSLLTGFYPPVHGQNGRYSYYDAEMTSPLRVLAAEGYDVLGHRTDGPTLDDVGFQRELKTNVSKSWYELENLIETRPTDAPPFFAWIHIKPTHLPYRPSEENSTRWIDTTRSSPGIDAAREHHVILRPNDVEVDFTKYAQGIEFSDDDIAVIRALYDGALADGDERLGQVLARMRENGLLDRTIVIITADHGEELFEHGWLGHASTSYDGKLYDELIRIPLLIRLPDSAQTGRFSALVQGVDVMPTIFEFLGIDAARVEPAMQGQSLMPIIGGDRDQVRSHVFNETTIKGWTTPKDEMRKRVVSARSATHKLIRFPAHDGYRYEGYDLRIDPREQTNIYTSQAADFVELERALQTWSDQNRTVAAALVQDAATRRIANIELALEQKDLLEAVQNWTAIETMHDTWGLEVDPFYGHEPYKSQWQSIRRTAASLIAQAMACAAENGDLRRQTAAQSTGAASWACLR